MSPFVNQITPEHCHQFDRDGFVILETFLGPQAADEALTQLYKLFQGEFETGVWPDKVKWQEGRDPHGVPRSICNAWKGDRVLARLLLHEEIGKAIARLMGWNAARLNQDTLLWVPVGAGKVTMHQDDSYQDWHVPGGTATCWMALADTTAGGGTLEYVRGSHKWKTSGRVEQFTSGEEDYRGELKKAAAEQNKELDIVEVVVPKGGAAFHHGNTWHGSGYNQSASDRLCMVSHCMDGASEFHPTTTNPQYSRYKRFNDTTMDESYFPLVWSQTGQRSAFLEDYCCT